MVFKLKQKEKRSGALTLCERLFVNSNRTHKTVLLSNLSKVLVWNTETIKYYITLLYKKRHKNNAEIIMSIITGLKNESKEIVVKINELRKVDI